MNKVTVSCEDQGDGMPQAIVTCRLIAVLFECRIRFPV